MPDVRVAIQGLMAERAAIATAIAAQQARLTEVDAQLGEIRALLAGEGPAAVTPTPAAPPPAVVRSAVATDRQARIVTHLRERGPVDTRHLAAHLGITRDSAFALLEDLRVRHVIASSGVRRGLRWHLPKEGLHAAGDRRRGASAPARRGSGA